MPYKALKDFNHRGVEIREGQEVPPDTFEPDDIAGLFAKGLLVDPDAKPAKAEPKKAAPKKAAKASKKK